MEMQLFAEELPAKSAGRETPASLPSKRPPSPSLKNTHCPHVALPETSLSSGHAFARRQPVSRGQKRRTNSPPPPPPPRPQPRFSACSGHQLPLYFSPSACHTNHPCSRFAPVVRSNHGFHSPQAWPLLPPLPLPAKPTSSLTSAEPMSMVTF